ncbi:MAG: ATP-binding protein [Vicinamibacterales bacterium]
MSEVADAVPPGPGLTRTVTIAGAGLLAIYAVLSLLTGQDVVWMGDIAQLVPPLAFAGLALALARRSHGQVRVFWQLSALHALIWASGQAVWTWYDLVRGGVPVISPTDPIFYASSIPVAAALYGRPDRDRPRWLFDIVVLDIVLIALFAAFVYLYFVVSTAVTGAGDTTYDLHLTQLLNARNLLLAVWAGLVAATAPAGPWKRMLTIYCLGLSVALVGGIAYDIVAALGGYVPGSLVDLGWMAPFVLLSVAAARAWDDQLLAPPPQVQPLSRLPVVSLVALALLVLIPTTDEIARRVLDVSLATESLRTRLALTMMIPFGAVVVVREFLSRRALLRAGQELVTTREQLAQSEKLAAVGQLVSGVAHELNNPLQGVLGYAELMMASRPGEPESEELRAIRENANRAAGIVRNLLTFAGRETPARSWQQVNRIVREAARRREPALAADGISLRLELAERLPLIYLDGVRFEQVVTNLIENAQEAVDSRRKGRALTPLVSPRAPGEIVITTRRAAEPERIFVEVADNGSGVRAEDLTRIFDPFFTTHGVEGTGLGLSVCYGIVREHGGTIRGQNRDGGGAVFSVELPVNAESYTPATVIPTANPVPPGTLAPESAPDTPHPQGRRARALVVDDEDSNAALVRRVLDQAGYEVDSTTLSRRALVMMERTPYDVVIADVKMPELGGQELYTRVCQIRPEMARRFIFITGDIDGEDTREFLEQSRCGYFMKPFNLERLTAAVDTLVGRAPDQIGQP